MRRVLTAVLVLAFFLNIPAPALSAPQTDSSHSISAAAISQMVFQSLQSLQVLAVSGVGAVFDSAASKPRPSIPTIAQMQAVKSNAKKGIPAGAGVRVPGPPMLQTVPSLDVLKHNRASVISPATKSAKSPSQPAATKNASALQSAPQSITLGSPNTTGINHWWSYEEGAIPGVGKYMVNIANGNLLVQSDDVDIPERGIDLAFRRTYNANSGRDWANTDGSANPGQYGGGWTNTFDAHLATNSGGGISVFDIDGARYDYTPNGNACLTPPTGMYNLLCSDGANGYYWFKKSGTLYYFYSPIVPPGLESYAGFAGRIHVIYGRNYNNYILFNYYWNGDASTAAHLNQIVAQHSDGHALTLQFAPIAGEQLLYSIQRPDGQPIFYGYDAYGNLAGVAEPANTNAPNPCTSHNYSFTASHQIIWAAGARWMCSGGAEGGYIGFGYTGTVLGAIEGVGDMNPIPADGTGAQLQQGPTGYSVYRSDFFSGFNSTETQFSDTDGHAANWFYDASGRVTHTQDKTGDAAGPANVDTYGTWDAQNNLISSIDARGNQTDYAYDTNGNAIAVALPQVTTSDGTFRPTSLYSYDVHNNLTAACDPKQSNQRGLNWNSRPPASDTLCAASPGATLYTYDLSDAYEPFGRLTDATTPMGYTRSFAYSVGSQGGDFGLPTSVTGTAISQLDGTQRTPQQTFAYDSYGNLTSYNKGNGATTLLYDTTNNPSVGINRLVQITDPDGVSSYRYYFPDGQLSKTESALQHATGMGTLLSYDADGNETRETHHHGCTIAEQCVAGVTQKFYDGASRLIEIVQPQDSSDIYTHAWMTRYLYDLTAGVGFPSVEGVGTVKAYGNLFATKEYLPPSSSQTWTASMGSTGKIENTTWRTINGFASDALDRSTAKYSYITTAAGSDQVNARINTYDANGFYGLPTQSCNQLNQCVSTSYNVIGQTTQISSNDANDPTRTLAYDADGRATAITSATLGTQGYAYDADGKTTSASDPQNIGAPAKISYNYYPDSMRKSVDVAPEQAGGPGLNQTSLLAYSYRADGNPQQLQINDNASWLLVGNSGLNYTYTSAGRLSQRSEFGPMANPTSKTFTYSVGIGGKGTLQSETLPNGTFSGLTYSAEGELAGYTSTPINNYPAIPVSLKYSSRGELLEGPGGGGRPANGTMIALATPPMAAPESFTWDARMGTMTSDVSGNPTTPTQGSATYDAAGRNTNVDSSTDAGTDENGDPITADVGITRTFDAENHTIAAVQTVPVARTTRTTTMGYLWGPNGHPAMIGTSTSSTSPSLSTLSGTADSLHWDGDQLLFTTNAQGQVDDIKIGNDGDITPLDSGFRGLTWWDRDPTGAPSMCHNSSGSMGSGVGSANRTYPQLPCHYANAVMSAPQNFAVAHRFPRPVGQGGLLLMVGRDGFTDGINTFQGVRTYDSQLGAWTTPDAYSGDVHDPASQKSYMWNGNNAVGYSDPSGFLGTPNTDILVPSWAVIGPGFAKQRIDEMLGVFIHSGNQLPNTLLQAALYFAQQLMEYYHKNSAWRGLIQSHHASFLEELAYQLANYLKNTPHTAVRLTGGVLSAWDNLGNSLRVKGDWNSSTFASNVGQDTIFQNKQLFWEHDSVRFTTTGGRISQAANFPPPPGQHGTDFDLERFLHGIRGPINDSPFPI